jgi:flavin reductase (DIM6/NTAB) family NADH-FMN oxidoreductase RutF/rubredoxin
LQRITYGLYVVGSSLDGRLNGQIANTVFQVTAEPPKLAACLNKNNLTHEFVARSRIFSVSVLDRDTPMQLIGLFGFKSGREVNKFSMVKHTTGRTGAPLLLENTLAHVECEVVSEHDVGTHTVFIGRVVNASIVGQGEPLTYAYYHQVKRGGVPKTATTYVGAISTGDKYRCKVCGYVYDPSAGDPESGVSPGTPFEKLPESWVCPVCGAGKDAFEKIG